jgi:HPt (histidine-containing phosphotransfer) domain-containing protein
VIDELHAKFLPQFTALVRARVAKALEAATGRDHAATRTTLRELHAIAGEAGLLGLLALVPIARAGEAKAQRYYTTQSDADADALVLALTELGKAVELVGSPPQEGRKP